MAPVEASSAGYLVPVCVVLLFAAVIVTAGVATRSTAPAVDVCAECSASDATVRTRGFSAETYAA
jgi:hypothetical protein